jgi:hypothetical protein
MSEWQNLYAVTAAYGNKFITVEVEGYEAASDYAHSLISDSEPSYGKVYVAIFSTKGRVWSYEIDKGEMKS